MILDTVGMFDAVAAFPEQLEVAAAAAGAAIDSAPLPAGSGVSDVVVLASGTGAQAGSILREIGRPIMAVPILTHEGYWAPNAISAPTLVLAISASGDDEETLDATAAALALGAAPICISGGGALSRFAVDHGLIHLPAVPEAPVQRAALGSLLVPALLTLGATELLPGADQLLHSSIEQVSRRRDSLITEHNEARRMARRLGRAFPIIYGGDGPGGTAAQRWKTQFNHNAKVAAFANQVPGLTHDEVCGWGQDGDVTRQVFQLFLLRHDFEHPQTSRRLDVIDDILDEVVGAIHGVQARGDGMLAQLLDLILIGDFVSLHASAEQGLDPGPVPILDELEARVRSV